MKRLPLIIALFGILAGIGGFASVYLIRTNPERELAGSAEPELAWMRQEFALTPEQFRELSVLHQSYVPNCAEMCRRIDLKNAELNRLLKENNRVTPEVRSVLKEMAELRAECQANMLEHFYAVASTMPPQQSSRYLTWVKEKCFGDFTPAESPSEESPHQHQMR